MRIREAKLPWWAAGVLLGLVLTVATALVQPLGVSTQYVVTDAVLLHAVAPGYVESNEYLAQHGAKEGWRFGYGWMLVFGMGVGGGLAAAMTGRRTRRPVPSLWRSRFGRSRTLRYGAAFLGGVLLLFGARFGGGCTSGHMISGISQLAVSSLLFSAALFPAAMVTARLLYGGRRA
jgi:uncharacterized membrane protein YedE/YeeE